MRVKLKRLAAKTGKKLETILYPKHKKTKNKKQIFWLITVPILIIVGLLVWYLKVSNIQVLDPQGIIGVKERGLMIFTIILGAAVVIPVFGLTIFIALRYREGSGKKVKYSPDWGNNYLAETIWWGIPVAIIVLIAVVTWISTHKLDPYKAIDSNKTTMNIQVVALDWKWLFIYPEQHIATVNFVQFPVNSQVNFALTSDTVMNSFWIPRLGGQIYAMPSMVTHLNLNSTKIGDYPGSAANIAGNGFSGMNFTTRVSSKQDFDNWIKYAKQSPSKLDNQTYAQLSKASKNNPVSYYSSVNPGLYKDIVMKYIMPINNMKDTPQSQKTPATNNANNDSKMKTNMNMESI